MKKAGVADSEAWRAVYSSDPPAYVVQFCDEPDTGGEKGGICWLVWTRRPVYGAALHWIVPGIRCALGRPGDYDQGA